MTPEQVKEVCQLYRSGLSCRKIAERFGVCFATIYKYVRRAKINRPRGIYKRTSHPSGQKLAKMRAMYNEGLSCREIGQRIGMGKDSVRYWLVVYGGVIMRKGGYKVRLKPSTDDWII